MIRLKSIGRHGKYLQITIKKPIFINYRKFLDKIIKVFSDEEYGEEKSNAFMDPMITENKDIQLTFILRSYKDIEPYIEKAREGKE